MGCLIQLFLFVRIYRQVELNNVNYTSFDLYVFISTDKLHKLKRKQRAYFNQSKFLTNKELILKGPTRNIHSWNERSNMQIRPQTTGAISYKDEFRTELAEQDMGVENQFKVK